MNDQPEQRRPGSLRVLHGRLRGRAEARGNAGCLSIGFGGSGRGGLFPVVPSQVDGHRQRALPFSSSGLGLS